MNEPKTPKRGRTSELVSPFVAFSGDVPVEVLQAAIVQTSQMHQDSYFVARATSDGKIEIHKLRDEG